MGPGSSKRNWRKNSKLLDDERAKSTAKGAATENYRELI